MKYIFLILFLTIINIVKSQTPVQATIQYKEVYETGDTISQSILLDEKDGQIILNGCSSFIFEKLTLKTKGKVTLVLRNDTDIFTKQGVDTINYTDHNLFNNIKKIIIIKDSKKIIGYNINISGCN